MLSIGDFAFHGRVSVRMLRHYDGLGLLVPAQVDPMSGYRRYDAAQLARLNRLLALKDLGFTLEQVGPILDADVGVEELRGMLTLRRMQIEQQISADSRRLTVIESRLRTIEKEHLMSDLTFTEKALPAQRIAQVTATVADHSDIGPTIGPMFGELMAACEAAGLDPDAPAVAWYAAAADGTRTEIAAAMPVAADAPAVAGTEAAELEAAPRAVTVVHHGSVETIGDTWQALMQYVGAAGLSPTGRCREVYLETPDGDEDDWVTELQQPVE